MLRQGQPAETDVAGGLCRRWWSLRRKFNFCRVCHELASSRRETTMASTSLSRFSSIAQTTVDVASIEAVIASVREQNLDKDVEAIVVSLLEEASS